MQRLRRTFAEHFAVFDREASQFDEAEAGCNIRDGCTFGVCAQKGPSCLRQAQHSKLTARREAADFVKCLAKRPLACLKSAAQGRDVQRLLEIGESQSLCLLDEIAARVGLLSEWRFGDGFEPLIDIH
ncbi:MAG: hypothetical protein JWP25_2022 [Bradyrhizobium sp.]|nr:hypothetical protein [Bradyrhizobium sp.]